MNDYFYSWEDEYTTDPEGLGKSAVIKCNGEEIKEVFWCRVGENGMLCYTDGTTDAPPYGELHRFFMFGNVEVDITR